jgi:hypothetical protein
VERQAGRREGGGGIGGLLDRHRLGQRHPRQAHARGIAEQGGEIAAVLIDPLDDGVLGVRRPAAAQRLDHHAVLRLHGIEHAGDLAQRAGHVQHAQRMTGRGRVDDDEIVPAGSGEPRDLEEGGQLVDPGERQPQETRDVFLVEPRPSQRDPLERSAAGGEPPLERAACIDLDRVQRPPADGDPAPGGAERRAQRVAERWSRIGGNDQGAELPRSRRNCRRSGARRLADSPFAADEQEFRAAGRPGAVTCPGPRRRRTWLRPR